MPATDVVILTASERRKQYAEGCCEAIVTFFIFLIPISVIVGVFGGFTFWMSIETTASETPINSFEKFPCELLTVDHRFNSTEFFCTDVFTYTWKTFRSPVVYIQKDFIRRRATDCLLDLNISAEDAPRKNGTNICYKVLDLYQPYTPYFNCAPVLEFNNASAGRCKTLLAPTSTYDATANFAIGTLAQIGLVFACGLWSVW